LYLGYQHLTTFVAWLVGLIAAGYLLEAFCPDPRKLDPPTRHEWRLATNPQYEFTLDEQLRADLGDQIPVPGSIEQALRDHSLELPENVTLAELAPKDARKSDPERVWRIEEQLLTVQEIWTTPKPWWKPWRSADMLRVTMGGLRWSDDEDQADKSFTLTGNLETHLTHDKPVSDEIRKVLAQHGFDLPKTASVRMARPKDRKQKEKAWKVVIRYYSIEESKLETDADAGSEGREKALRDVLVSSNTPRPPQQTTPLPDDYKNAHYIWYAFTGIGFVAFFALLIFKFVTNAIDKKRETGTGRKNGEGA